MVYDRFDEPLGSTAPTLVEAQRSGSATYNLTDRDEPSAPQAESYAFPGGDDIPHDRHVSQGVREETSQTTGANASVPRVKPVETNAAPITGRA